MKPRKPPLQSARLPDQLRERIRYLDYSQSTGKVYLYRLRCPLAWIEAPA